MSKKSRSSPVAVACATTRKSMPAELRMALAKQLMSDCVAGLGLREDRFNLEFTQHSGDEMVHPTLGGYNPEWLADEAGS